MNAEEKMKNGIIAACGLDCAQCNAYKAWKNDDDALRAKTAQEWSKAYSFDCKPEMINCSGCLEAKGPKIGHCADCAIRACVTAKKFDNCAACADMGSCKDIQEFIKASPEAKKNLDSLIA
jgi:hypothetical protein